jgi:hypothetical protein
MSMEPNPRRRAQAIVRTSWSPPGARPTSPSTRYDLFRPGSPFLPMPFPSRSRSGLLNSTTGYNRLVVGAYVAQSAEHFLGKEEVSGSNPDVGSIRQPLLVSVLVGDRMCPVEGGWDGLLEPPRRPDPSPHDPGCLRPEAPTGGADRPHPHGRRRPGIGRLRPRGRGPRWPLRPVARLPAPWPGRAPRPLDGGGKGRKSRRVPVTPRLASAIKRQARHRSVADVSTRWSTSERRSSPVPDRMDTLVIVPCGKSKIWDREPNARSDGSGAVSRPPSASSWPCCQPWPRRSLERS